MPRELLIQGTTSAPGSDPRHFRSRLSQLHTGKTADPQIAGRLQNARRRRFLTAKIPQRAAQPRHATHAFPPRDHAQGSEQMGRSPLILLLLLLMLAIDSSSPVAVALWATPH